MTVEAPNLLQESGLPIAYRAPFGEDAPPMPGFDVSTRTVVRSLTVMQKEALVTRTGSHSRWRLASDEGPYLAGHDFAPAPLAYMTVGLATDLLDAVGNVVDDPSMWITLDTFFGMQGSMRARTMTGSAKPPYLTVHTTGHDSPDVAEAVRAAVGNSLTADLARQVKTSRFTLTSHGRAIPVGKVTPAAVEAIEDPGSDAESPDPIEDVVSIVTKTRDVRSDPPDAGTSLEDRQDRGLHLRAETRRRTDGLVEIELHLFSPTGSTFTFLSEEPGSDGSAGRAPDSLSYVSAGLGFCFMTQIGRFAKIVKEELGAYHIVQDVGFSRGEVSRVSDPVTHVFLAPSGDDDFAREALDMSEQTCFLHAFCRTELDVQVELEPV